MLITTLDMKNNCNQLLFKKRINISFSFRSPSSQWSSKTVEHVSVKRSSQSSHSTSVVGAASDRSSVYKRDPSTEAEKRTSRSEVTKIDPAISSSEGNLGEKSSFLILSQVSLVL